MEFSFNSLYLMTFLNLAVRLMFLLAVHKHKNEMSVVAFFYYAVFLLLCVNICCILYIGVSLLMRKLTTFLFDQSEKLFSSGIFLSLLVFQGRWDASHSSTPKHDSFLMCQRQ